MFVLLAMARKSGAGVAFFDQGREQGGSEEPGAAQDAERQGLNGVIFGGSSYSRGHRTGIKKTADPRRTLSTKTLAPFAASRKLLVFEMGVRPTPTIKSFVLIPACDAGLPSCTERTNTPPPAGASASSAPSRPRAISAAFAVSAPLRSAIRAVTLSGLPSRNNPISTLSPTRRIPHEFRRPLALFLAQPLIASLI